MRKYLLPENGNFYKANLHCHTTCSDGKKTPEEVKEIYQSLGYSIVAYTDHDILIPHDELTDDKFLALHGFEMEINEVRVPGKQHKTCHICFIGLEKENLVQPLWHRSKYLFGNAPNYRDQVKFDDTLPDFERRYDGECITEIMQTAREKGFFVTYNHPTWSREDYSGYINYSGMHAFEMFNGSCIVMGFEDNNPRVYEDIIKSGKRIYCIGADDNHNNHPLSSRRCDSGKAFTMIRAENLDYRTITSALENGHFYASEAPEIYALWYEDNKVHIECSYADRIYCNFDVRSARIAYSEEDGVINEATLEIPEGAHFFRVTVVDKRGKFACTNAYFLDELVD